MFPSDFVVEEIWGNRVCDIRYSALSRVRDEVAARIQRRKEYLDFTLVKNNWETTRALKHIAWKASVSLKSFGISGMKDKNAYTAQRVSLWRGDAKKMVRLRLLGMFLKDFSYAEERITLGNHTENRFTVTIRDIPRKKKEIREILGFFEEIMTSQGAPNYYGFQRLEGGNAEVGKALKDGYLRLGVELILRKTQPYIDKGIDSVPNVFWYEKDMLRYLEKYPNDYAGALRTIPKRIRRLYLNAYQSQIFNEQLDKVLLEGDVPQTIMVPGFAVPRMPELSTVSFERKSIIKAKKFGVLNVGDGIATFSFILGKGEYATTILSNLASRK